MRAIDKLDRLGIAGVKQLLGEGRKDESGDFTKGAGLKEADIALVVGSVELGGALDPRLRDSRMGQEGRAELDEISRVATASGYGEDRIKIDPSVVRGLEYYTGAVFEVELLLETKDEKGRPVRFGSVGGGGRYDGLVSRFRGEPVPATGFSIGVSRLQAALTMLGKLDSGKEFGPVVVTVFGGDIADYQKMVATLRNAGIRAELYLGNPKHSLGQQMKYADRRNAPCAIVQGSDEKAKGKVQIKDLILGAGLTEIKDREEYLKRQAEAQTEVDQGQLVDAVRKILARHDVRWG
jgi:histidyl-tRNA synthetase